jgi:hypothetical protein
MTLDALKKIIVANSIATRDEYLIFRKAHPELNLPSKAYITNNFGSFGDVIAKLKLRKDSVPKFIRRAHPPTVEVVSREDAAQVDQIESVDAVDCVDDEAPAEVKADEKIEERRGSDSGYGSRGFTDTEMLFILAVDKYKSEKHRVFPTLSELFAIAKDVLIKSGEIKA